MKPINNKKILLNSFLLYKKYFLQLLITGFMIFLFSLPLFGMIYGINNRINVLIVVILVLYVCIIQFSILLMVKASIIRFIDKKENGTDIRLFDAVKQTSKYFFSLLRYSYLLQVYGFAVGFNKDYDRNFGSMKFSTAVSQSFYFVLLENQTPEEAIKNSHILTEGNKLRIYLLYHLSTPFSFIFILLLLNISALQNMYFFIVLGFIWNTILSPFGYAFDYSLWSYLKRLSNITMEQCNN